MFKESIMAQIMILKPLIRNYKTIAGLQVRHRNNDIDNQKFQAIRLIELIHKKGR